MIKPRKPASAEVVTSTSSAEIDKKELQEIVRRFQHLQKAKLARVQDYLHPSQRVFLQVLPLLYHTNHPAIPGYVSPETPASVFDYQPDAATLNVIGRIARSFVLKKRAAMSFPIEGIYLMGSVGSIAYSQKSDLDFWICHTPTLSHNELDELQQKASLIESWAETLNLEAHFFFIDTQRFKEGYGSELSDESCGDTQHHLLLEEFYRSGLLIAGKPPLWWIVPPSQEYSYREYTQQLTDKRFIDTFHCIDFGSLESVPSREFIGATLWQFYKAIESPHKSLLKLLLMEAYASEFPQPHWVSLRLKQAIYGGNTHPDQIDPYIMMYQKVENYLQGRNEHHRLELARQSFYFKINEMLSSDFNHPKAIQRRELLLSLTQSWNWSYDDLAHLDTRSRWPLRAVLEQQAQLIQELKQSYHEINQFARKFSTPEESESRDIQLLGRKLQANLDKKPGKLEIFSDSSQHLQTHLAVQRVEGADGATGWAFFPQLHTHKNKQKPLKKTRSLIELLAWGVVNRICNKRTSFISSGLPLSQAELTYTLISLEKFLFRQPLRNQSISIFATPPTLISCAVFLTPDEINETVKKSDGSQMTSSRFDPLSFGSYRSNLITHVELLLVNSWGEVTVRSFSGDTALFKAFTHIMNESPEQPIQGEQFVCSGVVSGHGQSMAIRTTNLWEQILKIYVQNTDNIEPRRSKLIIRLRESFITLEKKDQHLSYNVLQDETDLIEELKHPVDRFTHTIFDHLALERSPLPLIYEKNRAESIQVFLVARSKSIDLYILDERGSLFRQRYANRKPSQILAPYGILFQSVLQHTALGVTQPIEYFTVAEYKPGDFSFSPLKYTSPDATGGLSIRIMAEEIAQGQVSYTIFCDHREFSSLDYGDKLFHRVASHILLCRRSHENYPIYITDIDVPPSILGSETVAQLQTSHYLSYKRKIEARLNMLD